MRYTGVGEEGETGVGRSGVEGGESGDRQEEKWVGEGKSGDRQVWVRRGRVGIDRSGREVGIEMGE